MIFCVKFPVISLEGFKLKNDGILRYLKSNHPSLKIKLFKYLMLLTMASKIGAENTKVCETLGSVIPFVPKGL